MSLKSSLEIKGSNYSVPVTTPSGKILRLNELKNRDFLTLVKYCENEDFYGFAGIIAHLIPGFPALNILDKAYILIAYRSLFVDSDTQIINSDGAEVKIPVYTILDKLESCNIDKRTIEVDGYKVCITPFDNYQYSNMDSVFDCIESIEYCGISIDKHEVSDIIDRLPSLVFSTINKEIVDMYNKFTRVEIVAENTHCNLKSVKIGLMGDQFGKFIMSLYKVPLNNIFEAIFIYSQKMGSVDYFNLSPLDSQVLENILRREVSRANESNSSTPQHVNPLTPHE